MHEAFPHPDRIIHHLCAIAIALWVHPGEHCSYHCMLGSHAAYAAES